jgi:hypothetical protein
MSLLHRSLTASFVSLSIVSISLCALAQETPVGAPTTAQASDPSSSAAPVAPAASAATNAPQAKDQAAASTKSEATPSEGHFRWGLSPMGGSFFPGPATVAFGIEGRAGYAFNDTITLFGSLGGVAGVGFGGDLNANGASASVSAVSYWYAGANVDALLAGPLFVGGGAAIGKGGWGAVSQSASSSGGSQEVTAAGGIMPSLNARLGLATGKLNRQTGKRSGFAIALDLRMLIAPDSTSTAQSAGTGGVSQTVATNTTAIGWSPMLMMGYELR